MEFRCDLELLTAKKLNLAVVITTVNDSKLYLVNEMLPVTHHLTLSATLTCSC